MNDGLVIKQEANFYSVSIADQVYLCSMRANLKKAGEIIKVGDRVRLEELEAERPVIAEIYPRTTELHKPAVANVNQVLIVMSCLQPDFNFLLVDRLLLAIKYEGLDPVLCISKADLMDAELEEYLTEEYAAFEPLIVSVATGAGLDALRQRLVGKVSVLAGASGTGKSSMINQLNPEIHLQVGEVNQLGIGKHTTRHVSLHRVDHADGIGWVADSPGFNNLGIPPIDPQELCGYYPEFEPFLGGQCFFGDCLHRFENGCAVKDSVDTESERFYNYLRLLTEAEEGFRERTDAGKTEGLTKRAVGKNQRDQVLKLGTVGRARSRRVHRQIIEQVGNWSDIDEESLEELAPDEWRI
ncbi:MAG: ribosome small subunit-dependent GTPase A [Candidatus Melainabacteria bacterium HGW-Melainabacteria-1]|nr:MAG: ribosome small subunit-dependent GTPase A [Candidatus Melainabacteria bacterium HGW-Melainabacteria-1]